MSLYVRRLKSRILLPSRLTRRQKAACPRSLSSTHARSKSFWPSHSKKCSFWSRPSSFSTLACFLSVLAATLPLRYGLTSRSSRQPLEQRSSAISAKCFRMKCSMIPGLLQSITFSQDWSLDSIQFTLEALAPVTICLSIAVTARLFRLSCSLKTLWIC